MQTNIKNKNIAGFTLIEILIVVGIIGLLAITVGGLSRDTFFLNDIFKKGINATEQAQKIIRPMAGEIRSASASTTGTFAIESATDNSFIFFSDIDNDNLKERVRYYVENGVLKKGITKPIGSPAVYTGAIEKITTVVPGLSNGVTPVFSYYDGLYEGTTNALVNPVSPQAVRLVKVTLIVDDDPTRPPEPVTITTQASIRNLKDNL